MTTEEIINAPDLIDKAFPNNYVGPYGLTHPIVLPTDPPQHIPSFWDKFPPDTVAILFIIIVVMLVIWLLYKGDTYHD